MRLRVRYTKLGKVRFLGHRDVARVWERCLRRAALPLVYTEGFSPRPKLHFGLALPNGATSVAEFIDVDVRDDAPGVDLAPATLVTSLSDALPVGMDVTAVAPTESIGATSLQQLVTSSTWQITMHDVDHRTAGAAIDRTVAAESLVVTRQRKGKDVTDDLRPYLHHLALVANPDPSRNAPSLVAELGTQPRGVRPSELLALLGPEFASHDACRLHQWISSDGTRQEPLAPDPSSAPCALVHAS